MLNIRMPAGWFSPRQLQVVWLWARHVALQLDNGAHCLLPQAMLSGNPRLPLSGAVVTLVLPADLAVVLCRLSCPDTKMIVSCSP